MPKIELAHNVEIEAKNKTEASKKIQKIGILSLKISQLDPTFIHIRLPYGSAMTLGLNPITTENGVAILERCNLITGKNHAGVGYRLDWKQGLNGVSTIFGLDDNIETLEEIYNANVQKITSKQCTDFLREYLLHFIEYTLEKFQSPKETLREIIANKSKIAVIRIVSATENFLEKEIFAKKASEEIPGYIAHHIIRLHLTKNNQKIPHTPAEEEKVISSAEIRLAEKTLKKIILSDIIQVRIAPEEGGGLNLKTVSLPLNNRTESDLSLILGKSVGDAAIAGTKPSELEHMILNALQSRDDARDVPVFTSEKTISNALQIAMTVNSKREKIKQDTESV